MPLSMTKIAYRSGSFENLRKWVERDDEALMTTRYLPKRHEEMIGGSLYWIIEHAIVARSEILADSGLSAQAISRDLVHQVLGTGRLPVARPLPGEEELRFGEPSSTDADADAQPSRDRSQD